ncbi:hypothetical protein WDA79_13810 [Streptomyces sp. A475]|uniref:hypothetical protein n=1 Tax=Streptomyces sp. A475 TaxID=3131976 RepID=UPI0030C96229
MTAAVGGHGEAVVAAGGREGPPGRQGDLRARVRLGVRVLQEPAQCGAGAGVEVVVRAAPGDGDPGRGGDAVLPVDPPAGQVEVVLREPVASMYPPVNTPSTVGSPPVTWILAATVIWGTAAIGGGATMRPPSTTWSTHAWGSRGGVHQATIRS